MANSNISFKPIIIVLFSYAFLSVLYIFLETSGIISISNPVGATLYDQNIYHIPQINYFLNNDVNLNSYQSFTATTPGQHLIYSIILKQFNIKTVDGNFIQLRLLHLLFNLAAIFFIWYLFYSVNKENLSTIYLLPVICSPYFINGALYITTDNLAIGLTAATLMFTINKKIVIKNLLIANIFNSVSIFWRQNTIWLQIPIFIKNLIFVSRTRKYYSLLIHLLPIGLLIYFLIIWGGLTPKEFQYINAKRINFSSIVYSISLYALINLFYSYEFYFVIRKINYKVIIKVFIIGVTIGILLGSLIPSEANKVAGRWGGYLWTISKYLPNFFERSVLFVSLTVLGSTHFIFMSYILIKKKEYLLLISFLAWLISTIGSFIVFHRYFEPILILFTSIFILTIKSNDNIPPFGPTILAIFMLIIFFVSLFL